MRDFFLLVKLNFTEMFSSINKKNKTKYISLGAAIFSLVLLMTLLSVSYNYLFYSVYKTVGDLSAYFELMFTLTTFMIFLTSITKMKTMLFGPKDYELLQTLPLKSSAILASKIFSVFLYELVFSVIFMGPCLAFILTSLSVVEVIIGVVIILLLPLLPVLISAFFGFIFALFLDKTKISTIIYTFFVIALVLGILYVSYSGNTDQEMASTYNSIVGYIKKIYPMVKMSRKAIDGEFIPAILFCIINIGSFAVLCLVFGLGYKKINNMIFSYKFNNKYVSKELSGSSITKSLVKREFSRISQSSIYLVNSMMGGVMSIASIAIMYVVMNNNQGSAEEIQKALDGMTPFVYLIALFCIGMAPLTNVCISIEGKTFWILKSSPIEVNKIFKSKIIFGCIMMVPFAIVSSIVSIIMFKMSIFISIMTVIIPLLYCVTVQYLGIIINLTHPKMEWLNETQVVKQSASVFFTMLYGFLILIVLCGAMIPLSFISLGLAYAAVIVILLGLLIFFVLFLNTNGQRWFKNIN